MTRAAWMQRGAVSSQQQWGLRFGTTLPASVPLPNFGFGQFTYPFCSCFLISKMGSVCDFLHGVVVQIRWGNASNALTTVPITESVLVIVKWQWHKSSWLCAFFKPFSPGEKVDFSIASSVFLIRKFNLTFRTVRQLNFNEHKTEIIFNYKNNIHSL